MKWIELLLLNNKLKKIKEGGRLLSPQEIKFLSKIKYPHLISLNLNLCTSDRERHFTFKIITFCLLTVTVMCEKCTEIDLLIGIWTCFEIMFHQNYIKWFKFNGKIQRKYYIYEHVRNSTLGNAGHNSYKILTAVKNGNWNYHFRLCKWPTE